MFGARFDDVAAGSSFILTDPITAHIATSIDDVATVLDTAALAAANGHWVAGYIAHDAAGAFDPALRASRDPTVPYAWFGVFAGREELGTTSEESGDATYTISRWTPLADRATYDDAFATITDHITAGDVHQVNLALSMRAAFSGDPSGLYLELLRSQEAGYASHLRHDDTHVLSVSPERFFTVDGERVVAEPIKGTRPRGRWAEEDFRLRGELASSGKDRADNLMIVDLLRSDLGRISRSGTVVVDDLCAIAGYRTVWQMSSRISAELRDDVTTRDIIAALFPCGSVTGAPRATAMEIISQVEPTARGVYGGTIGFIPPGDGRDGSSFSVAIRTAVVHLDEGVVQYGVGGGVTWDSSLEGEFEEAMAKAVVLTSRPLDVDLIETIRWDGDWLWLDEHLARMSASASFLGLDLPSEDVRAALQQLARILSEPTQVRIVLSPRGSVSVFAEEAPVRFAMHPGPNGEAISVALDFDPVDRKDLRLFHRTSDRFPYESRERRHPDVDDVILTNDVGHVTESTIGNVVCLFDDAWVTPPVADGLLAGVLRGRLLDEGFITEDHIPIRRLLEADAVALVDSVGGWRSAMVVQSR
jgi:para-aminobenzoate synthetase / 4-amino-4-deoxychorismate lyase